MGPCVKDVVKAILVAKNGMRFIGTNYCVTPQTVCPRVTAGFKAGEGYHLCKSVCNQPGHAEENAIRSAGPLAKGSKIYVEYKWVCDNCKRIAYEAGAEIIIGSPPND